MTPDVGRLVGATVGMLAGSFVLGCEAAVASLPEARLRALLDDLGPKRGRQVARFLDDPTTVLSRLLAFRVVAIIVAAVLATEAVPRAERGAWTLVAIVTVLTFVYGVVAEIFTSIGRARAWQLAPIALGITRPLELLMIPFAAPLAWLGRAVQAIASSRSTPPPAPVSEREVEYLVEQAENVGAIDARRGEMVQRVLELKDRTARDVMVPRTRVNAIDADTTLEEAVVVVTEEGHSRVPVFKQQIDNIVGVLHVKDLFRTTLSRRRGAGVSQATRALTADTTGSRSALAPRSDSIDVPANGSDPSRVESIARKPPLFVAHNQNALAVLREMQTRRVHLAIVLDEYGAMIGVVTLEDILEEVVGEIHDEHDTVEVTFVDKGDGRFIASASIPINELAENLGTAFPEGDAYSSLGGFMAERSGRVPSVGTEVEYNGWKFLVREGDERRATTVEITRSRSAELQAFSTPPD